MITVRKFEEGLVFGLAKTHRLDMTNAGKLEKKVLKKRSQAREAVLIDLTGIRFIDSRGFSILLRIQGRILDEDLKFRIIHVSEEVEELIRLLKLERVLDYSTGNPFAVPTGQS